MPFTTLSSGRCPPVRAAAALAAAAAALIPGIAFAEPVTLTASLAGANETAGGDADGIGGFRVEMDPETNDFCYTLWVDKVAKPGAAHVHSGEAGSNGPPVVTLEVTGKDSDECIAVEKEKLEPIAANPAAFYVNVHNAEFPAGALRGQLAKGE